MLRHDIGEKKKVGTISEAYPHLIVNNFTSRLGERVGNILKYLFPCPKVCAHPAIFFDMELLYIICVTSLVADIVVLRQPFLFLALAHPFVLFVLI